MREEAEGGTRGKPSTICAAMSVRCLYVKREAVNKDISKTNTSHRGQGVFCLGQERWLEVVLRASLMPVPSCPTPLPLHLAPLP